jgi:hypothetical protein
MRPSRACLAPALGLIWERNSAGLAGWSSMCWVSEPLSMLFFLLGQLVTHNAVATKAL